MYVPWQENQITSFDEVYGTFRTTSNTSFSRLNISFPPGLIFHWRQKSEPNTSKK